MKFDLKRPCGECPFRNDRTPYLRKSRVISILHCLVNKQATFSCHKTNVMGDDEGEMTETEATQHCAGALILLEKINRPNQLMRVAERLGFYDRQQLDMGAPIYDNPRQMVDAIRQANAN